MEESKWNSRKLLALGGLVLLAIPAMWAPADARHDFYELIMYLGSSYVLGQSGVDAVAQWLKGKIKNDPH